MRRTAILAAALLATPLVTAACQPEADKPAETASAPQPATLPAGATLSYVRSNQDGTMPEHIYVHIASPSEVHVAKMVNPCTDAAYVTARFDPASGEATQLVGGRLQKDGTQLPQAWLTVTPDRKLEVRLGDPDGPPSESHDAPPAPWRMYDFDLAEFALFGPREAKDFTFGMALAWPDGSSPLVRILGSASAAYKGKDERLGRRANHFSFSGPAFEGAEPPGGEVLFDEQYGYVTRAAFGKPNHPGYKDFIIKLNSAFIEDGDTAWREAIADHWRDC